MGRFRALAQPQLDPMLPQQRVRAHSGAFTWIAWHLRRGKLHFIHFTTETFPAGCKDQQNQPSNLGGTAACCWLHLLQALL